MPAFACLLDEGFFVFFWVFFFFFFFLWCFTVVAFKEMSRSEAFSSKKIPGFTYNILLLLEFISPLGLVTLSGSSSNGPLSSLQDCLIEDPDLGVQVLPFVGDLLCELISLF